MRASGFAVVLAALASAAGCDEARVACRGASPPRVRLGVLEGESFRELSDSEPLSVHASPQGGFGVLLYVETEGLASSPPHAIDIDLEIHDVDDEVGGFALDVAPLRCDVGAAGFYGGLLARMDPERFGTLDDLGALDGRQLRIDTEVTDTEGVSARTVARIVLGVDTGGRAQGLADGPAGRREHGARRG